DGWVCRDCRYDKNILFPVGEQFVSAQNSATDSKAIASDSTTIIPFQGHSIATYICFEALVPDYVRKLAKDAELLINPSYDGWFGNTEEAPIHEALSRMRAIENRKPLVRAAMSGISTIVDPVGRIVQRAGVQEEKALISRVTFMKNRTVYSYVGNRPWWVVVAALLFVRIFAIRRARGQKEFQGVG
ncbi:MAG: hypothetical protein JXR45_12780, partial [Deltaproteobacteria bacterium]|nr:hypothetical protein [Deltaproteobacteria bacterium]